MNLTREDRWEGTASAVPRFARHSEVLTPEVAVTSERETVSRHSPLATRHSLLVGKDATS